MTLRRSRSGTCSRPNSTSSGDSCSNPGLFEELLSFRDLRHLFASFFKIFFVMLLIMMDSLWMHGSFVRCVGFVFVVCHDSKFSEVAK